jgi:hypothetical protein
MSHTIKPVKWLEETLRLLGVEDIIENTTNEVVNDGELWKCSLAFNIPIRYNKEVCQEIVQVGRATLTKIGAQINVVLFSLQTIERIGYHIPAWSALKIQALQQRSLNVS